MKKLGQSSLLLLLGVSACVGTETDNPVSEQPDDPPGVAPPEYDGPDRWDAPEGGSSGEPCMAPEPIDRPLWWRANERLVGWDWYRGLSILDVSDPSEPKLLSELALPTSANSGGVHEIELVVTADGAAVEALVALRQQPRINSERLPDVEEFLQRDVILRIDLRDPEAPNVIGTIELDGGFREMLVDERGLYVTSWLNDAAEPACPYISRCPTFSTLRVTHHDLANGQVVDAIDLQVPHTAELPATVGRATLTSQGALTRSGNEVSFVRFLPDGSLSEPESIALGGQLTDFDAVQAWLTDGELRVVFQSEPDVWLERHRTGGDEPGLLSRVQLGTPDFNNSWRVEVDGDLLFIQLGRENVTSQIWALSDGAETQLELPEPMRTVLPLSALGQDGNVDMAFLAQNSGRAIAWFGEPTSLPTELGLLRIEDSTVTVIDRWSAGDDAMQTDLEGFTSSIGFMVPEQVTLNDRYLVARDLGRVGRISAIEVSDDSLRYAGASETPWEAARLEVDDWLFVQQGSGFTYFQWGSDETATFRADDVTYWNHMALGPEDDPTEAQTLTRFGASPTEIDHELRISRDDEHWSFPLSPTHFGILPVEGAVVVPALEAPYCEADGCDSEQSRVSIFTLGDEPRESDELADPSDPEALLEGTSALSLTWSGWNEETQPPLPLGKDRWVFTLEAIRECSGQAQCDDLGAIPRYYDSIDEWRGARGQRQLHTLHVDEEGKGSWAEPVTSVRVGPNSRWGRMLTQDDTLYLERIEDGYFVWQREGATDAEIDNDRVSVFVDRFVLNDRGELDTLPPVNIPGRFVGALDDATWLSVQPRPGTGGGSTLYRLHIEEDGATIEASLELPGFYLDLRLVGGFAVLFTEPAAVCGGTPQLTAIDPEGSMRQLETLELSNAWSNWTLVEVSESSLLLSRDYYDQHFALFNVGSDGEITLRSFRASTCGEESTFDIQLDRGIVSCSSVGYGPDVVEF